MISVIGGVFVIQLTLDFALLQNVMNVVTIMESAKMEPAFAHQVGMANFAAYQDVLIIALIEENVL